MANDCYSQIIIKANEPEIKELKNTLDKLSKAAEPVVPNGFGNLFLGCVLYALGVEDWQSYHFRGEIISYEISNGNLHLEIVSAWSFPIDAINYIAEKYDAVYYYIAEEFGCGIFETNDVEREYFKDIACWRSENGDTVWYENEQELFDDIESEIEVRPTNLDEARILDIENLFIIDYVLCTKI